MYLGSLYVPRLRNHVVATAQLMNIVPYTLSMVDNLPAALVELLQNSDTYSVHLDPRGFLSIRANADDVRMSYEMWGSLPDEETLTDVMRAFHFHDEFLLTYPTIKDTPSCIDRKAINCLTIADDNGFMCCWNNGWKYEPTVLKNLQVSLYLFPLGPRIVDEEQLAANVPPQVEESPEFLPVDTVLWLDEGAAPQDPMLCVEKIKSHRVLKMTRAHFRALLDWGTDIAQRKQVKRARTDPSLCVPSSRILWRAVAYDPSEGHVDYVRASWRVLMVSHAESFASGTVPPSLLQTWLPPSTTDAIEPEAEQLSAICERSFKSNNVPKMALKIQLYAEDNPLYQILRELNGPFAEFGLGVEPDGKYTRYAYLRRHLKSNLTMHVDNVPLAYDGFRLRTATAIVTGNCEQCCICASGVADAMLDSCGHAFCQGCLSTLSLYSSSCPTCRVPFDEWTLFSNTIARKVETPSFRWQMLAYLTPSPLDAIVASNKDVGLVLREWFPRTPIVHLGETFVTKPARLLFSFVPFPTDPVHEIVQNAMHAGLQIYVCAEAESSDETIAINWSSMFCKGYKGMTEESSYAIL